MGIPPFPEDNIYYMSIIACFFFFFFFTPSANAYSTGIFWPFGRCLDAFLGLSPAVCVLLLPRFVWHDLWVHACPVMETDCFTSSGSFCFVVCWGQLRDFQYNQAMKVITEITARDARAIEIQIGIS